MAPQVGLEPTTYRAYAAVKKSADYYAWSLGVELQLEKGTIVSPLETVLIVGIM